MDLTIGVCAFNEASNIRALLRDVLGQTGLPQNVRVIVVASGCTDHTPDLVREVMKNDPRVILIEEEARTGMPHAINLMLTMCPRGLLVLVDADIRLPNDALDRILRALSNEMIGLTGGSAVVGNCESSAIAKSASIIWRVMTRALNELSLRGELSYVMGQLCCFRTSLVPRIPDDVVNDDAYIATLVRGKGYKIVLAPGAEFVTRVPSTISDYIAQRRRVTFGHMQLKAQTGRYATSMEGIALDHTWILARAMILETISHPTSIVRALLVLELEVIVWLLARLDLLRGRQHLLWKRIETTKRPGYLFT